MGAAVTTPTETTKERGVPRAEVEELRARIARFFDLAIEGTITAAERGTIIARLPRLRASLVERAGRGDAARIDMTIRWEILHLIDRAERFAAQREGREAHAWLDAQYAQGRNDKVITTALRRAMPTLPEQSH